MSGAPTPTPRRRPSSVRTTWLLLKLAARRFANKLGGAFSKKAKDKGTGNAQPTGRSPTRKRRAATGRKTKINVLIWFGAIALAFQSVSMSSLVTTRAACLAEREHDTSGKIWLGGKAHRHVRHAAYYISRADSALTKNDITQAERDAEVEKERAGLIEDLVELAGGLIDRPPDWGLAPAEAEHVRTVVDHLLRDGLEGFVEFDEVFEIFEPVEEFSSPAARQYFVEAIATILALLFLTALLMTLGSGNQDLGRVDWSFEWLFQFPVPARGLMLAKLCEYTIINPMSWLLVSTFSGTLFFSVGLGWTSIPLALVATLVFATSVAAFRLAIETWLRLNWPMSRVKNVQATCTIVGILALYAVLWLVIAQVPPDWFPALVDAAGETLLWLPCAWPAWLAAADPRETGQVLVLTGLGIAIVLIALVGGLFVCAHLVRNGIISSSAAPAAGRRGKAAPQALGGVLAKERRLWLRDRNFLVQTTLVPILIFGFQLVINPGWLAATARDFQIAAVTAYGTGAYVLLLANATIVTGEGNALWLLFTFPQQVGRVFRQKVALWLGVSLAYAFGILIFLGRFELRLDVAFYTCLVLLGLVIYAYISAGLAVLAANPLEQNVQRRVKPSIAYLSMMIAAMYSWSIFAPHWWTPITAAVLMGSLAIAIWNAVEERMPFMLDPTAAPTPRVGVIHGLVAAFLFTVVQGLVLAIATKNFSELDDLGAKVTIAFAVGGGVAIFGTILVFTLRRMPWVEVVGLGGTEGSLARAIGFALAASVAAAAVAAAYLFAIWDMPAFTQAMESAPDTGMLGDGQEVWMYVLAVVAAPIVEEFIFRGLLFRGMRHAWGFVPSMLASAAIFAVIHPAWGWPAVFGLGCATAWTLERTNRLPAAMLVHALYNAFVIWFQFDVLT